jgi:hypothetical protein
VLRGQASRRGVLLRDRSAAIAVREGNTVALVTFDDGVVIRRRDSYATLVLSHAVQNGIVAPNYFAI